MCGGCKHHVSVVLRYFFLPQQPHIGPFLDRIKALENKNTLLVFTGYSAVTSREQRPHERTKLLPMGSPQCQAKASLL